MRITAVRHGETTANRDKITQGQLDTELTDTGKQQAQRVAHELSKRSFDRIISSDLTRCVDTAAAIAEYHPFTTVETDTDLREYNFGIYQGVPTHAWDWPDQVDDHSIDAKAPDGESAREVSRRIVRVVNDLYELQPDQQVLFVTHGGVIRLLRVLTGEIPFRDRMLTKIENGSEWHFDINAPLEELR